MNTSRLLTCFTFLLFILFTTACSKDAVIELPIPPSASECLTDKTFELTTHIRVIQDNFNGTSLVVIGDQVNNFLVAYESVSSNGDALSFEAVQEQLPVVMRDNEGNRWNVFGEALEGDRKGQRLQQVNSYIGYWFSWGTFYPGIEIYEGESRTASSNEVGTGNWLVPEDQVLNGAARDGIPALENPQVLCAEDIDYLKDTELVIGFKAGDDARAYPHHILDWHEIINDQLEETAIAITYCPLTGTGIGWDRNVEGNLTTFGVSGKLYNTNLIPYDRATDSNWSQMRLDCINGSLQGTEIETLQIIETTWATWQAMYPGTKVATRNTGHNRAYGSYPYVARNGDDYRTADEYLIFPITFDDDRLPRKERVLGVIIGGKAKAYRFETF